MVYRAILIFVIVALAASVAVPTTTVQGKNLTQNSTTATTSFNTTSTVIQTYSSTTIPSKTTNIAGFTVKNTTVEILIVVIALVMIFCIMRMIPKKMI